MAAASHYSNGTITQEQDHPFESLAHLTLPSATPLSHSSPALRSNGPFDPSDLLCSLLPASLSTQAQQLIEYDEKLSQELETVVDEEYKDFIALAARLAGERQRIDRLANWAGGTGPQGLEGVRLCVEEERREVIAAQAAVQQLVHHKQMIETRKADLRLLLSFSDVLERLEGLLMIPAKAPANHTIAHQALKLERNSVVKQPGTSAASRGSYQADDADLLEALQEDTAGQMPELKQPSGTPSRLPSNPTPTQQERAPSDYPQHIYPGRKLDLPTRIARAKTTWENLDFLRRAAASHRGGTDLTTDSKAILPNQDPQHASSSTGASLSPFLTAHDERLSTIQTTLKGDLRSLFSRLMTPGALLVDVDQEAGLQPNANSLRDLDRWSQIPSNLTQAETRSLKLQERSAWMNMVLDAWTRIGSANNNFKAEIQEHLREKLIAPWCRDHVRLAAQQAPAADHLSHSNGQPGPRLLEAGKDGEPQPLVNMFNLILRFVHSITKLTALLDAFEPSEQAMEQPSRNLHLSDLSQMLQKNERKLRPFEDVLWTEISTAISEQVGDQLFYVGASEEFHQNYTTTRRFLDVMNAYCPSTEARQAWCQHPSFAAFNRRWQLSVYFQMRYRIIATSLERDLGSMPINVAVSADRSPLPLLRSTQSAVNAFMAPWAPGAHLQPLISRQWRLNLMVVARYYNYVYDQQLLLTRTDGQQGDMSASSNKQLPNSVAISSVPPRTSTPDPDAQAREDRTLKSLAVLAADSLWFKNEINKQMQRYILPLIIDSGLQEDIDPLRVELQAALDGAFPIEPSLFSPISSAITLILKTRCAEALRLVRSINTQYRSGTSTPSSASASLSSPSANNKVDTTSVAHNQGQTEPSYFVPVILKPLRSFLGKGERSGETFLTPGRLVGGNYRSKWAIEVVEDVAVRYAASLTQLIQNYESLRRLKRGGLTAGGGSAGGGGGGFGGLASSFFRSSVGTVASHPTSSSSSGSGGSATANDPEWLRLQGQMKVDVARLEEDVKGLTEVGVEIDLKLSEPWKLLRDVVGLPTSQGQDQDQDEDQGVGEKK